MRIIIISRSSDNYFNKRVLEESDKKGIRSFVVNPFKRTVYTNPPGNNGMSPEPGDIFIVRNPPYREEKDYIKLVTKKLEMSGSRVINRSEASEISGNKFLTSLVLAQKGIPCLPSAAVRDIENLDAVVDEIGGYPVFLKTIFGTRGIGVIFCGSRETLGAAAQTMWAYGANVMIEKFASEARGKTIRVLVFEDRIIGAAECSAEPEDKISSKEPDRLLRSNFSRGGNLKPFEINEETNKTALNAVAALGLDFAGVDMIFDEGIYKILEINSSPGIKGFEQALNINAAGEIVSMICERRA